MNKKNTTKKPVKKAYVIDMTWCEDVNDLKTEIIYAKAKNGVAITENDLDFIVVNAIYDTIEAYNVLDAMIWHTIERFVNENRCKCCKKTPWYKRAWNWLLGRK